MVNELIMSKLHCQFGLCSSDFGFQASYKREIFTYKLCTPFLSAAKILTEILS